MVYQSLSWSKAIQIISNNLSFSYSGQHKKYTIQDVNLEITGKELFGIVGKNGAGKSTLAQLLTKLLPPTTGTIRYDPDNLKPGLVFQHPEQQFFGKSLWEDCAYPLQLQGYSPAKISHLIADAFAMVGLSKHYFTASPFSLSTGELRLAAIAAVLACSPQVLILDEPTAGLDPYNSKKIMQLLQQFPSYKDMIVIVISHHVENIVGMSQQAALLHAGKILWQGATQQLLAEKALLEQAELELPLVTAYLHKLKQAGWHINDNLFQAKPALASLKESLIQKDPSR